MPRAMPMSLARPIPPISPPPRAPSRRLTAAITVPAPCVCHQAQCRWLGPGLLDLPGRKPLRGGPRHSGRCLGQRLCHRLDRFLDFPTTPGAFQTIFRRRRLTAFVTKLNPAGSALVYSTYLGGSEEVIPWAHVSGRWLGQRLCHRHDLAPISPTTPGAFQTNSGRA